jgi:hypothetical protein
MDFSYFKLISLRNWARKIPLALRKNRERKTKCQDTKNVKTSSNYKTLGPTYPRQLHYPREKIT